MGVVAASAMANMAPRYNDATGGASASGLAGDSSWVWVVWRVSRVGWWVCALVSWWVGCWAAMTASAQSPADSPGMPVGVWWWWGW